MGERLLAALYAAPRHGPIVARAIKTKGAFVTPEQRRLFELMSQ